MSRFQFLKGMMVTFVAAINMLVVPVGRGAAENQSARNPITQNGKPKTETVQQESEKKRIDVLRAILASDKDYAEKAKAAEALGVMQSQAAASVLLENLMSFRSVVRKGPQMWAVIGMYPCAIALVENGTNSIPPVIEHLQHSEKEEVQRICMEVLNHTQNGVGSMDKIRKKLCEKMGEEERTRLEVALEYLQRSTGGESEP